MTTTAQRRVRQSRRTTANSVEPREKNPTWYKDALIYQLHVRAFADSNADGVGDFRGLTQHLDYIRDLGITAIWLLPFYPSPLRDDGYDIADYTSINRAYGTLRDFRRFLDEAHRRDLRVITELVLNHTSDEHRWFQKSRRARPGSKWRNYYVWSDDPQRYKDTRIIFRDFETSNWTWDPIGSGYYWHRFYAHQPDLNFDNPEVREAMFRVLDFWLELGVDGFRLDAVPYLFEREGTTCENLPETHAFLRELRGYVDERYEDKLLLAEANQWPEDAAAYFGNGDECHMNFHFPLMPRLFMAVQREDRFPVVDILQQTPEIHDSCQWATFLRNHDELTLEMVTDEERDYMYRSYAEDPTARINLGIRRRLAPLLKNNRRKIELMNALLMSLPGTPVIYYGDEIGMGDNIYLGDRDGVRTPMQWNGDRNAGFSEASQQRLYLPVITEAEYHYSACNVENSQNSRHSLLWWMRRLIQLRKQHMVFGRGTIEFLSPDNSKVLAYLRQHEDEVVLVVANLSRFVQGVELDLSQFAGRVAVEMIGRTRLPAIGQAPYFLTLGPHSFYWLQLAADQGGEAVDAVARLPELTVTSSWSDILSGKARGRLETVLGNYLHHRRWFAGKARQIRSTSLRDALPVAQKDNQEPIYACLLNVQYVEGEDENYLLPVSVDFDWQEERVAKDESVRPIAWIDRKSTGDRALLYEAIEERPFWIALLELVRGKKTLAGEHGDLAALRTSVLNRILPAGDEAPAPHVHGGQQSNTSAIFGDRFIFKLFRRVSSGVNPDLEVGRFLTQKINLEHVPQVAGALEYRGSEGDPMTVAILHQYQAHEGDAWEFTLDELSRYYESGMLPDVPQDIPAHLFPQSSLLELAQHEIPEAVHGLVGSYLHAACSLGRRTAELHLALASDEADPGFAPEPMNAFHQRGLYQSMRTQAKHVLQLLRKSKRQLPPELQERATCVASREIDLVGCFKSLTEGKLSGLRTRIHGDFHLGQVLYTGKDFVIIDFEGEPDRPLSERKIKASPLRDVAGMLRSLDYAAHAVLMGQAPGVVLDERQRAAAAPRMRLWYTWCATAFLREYLQTAAGAAYLPQSNNDIATLLNAYVLQKLLYELSYELNNRPSWAGIPLAAIEALLSAKE